MEVIKTEYKDGQGRVVAVIPSLDYTEEVERGAAWLDENVGPNWTDEIDLPSLDLASTSYCVLGQVFMKQVNDLYGTMRDGFSYATERLEPFALEDGNINEREVHRHGFDIGHSAGAGHYQDIGIDAHSAYEHLAQAWIKVIQERRAAEVPA